MTGILGGVNPDGVVFYSDGATYNSNGVIEMFAQKTDIYFPGKMLVATRGSGRSGISLRARQTYRQDFDDAVDHLEEDLYQATDEGYRVGDPCNLAVLVGGWSDREQKWLLARMWAAGDHPITVREGSYTLEVYQDFHAEPFPSFDMLRADRLITKDDAGVEALNVADDNGVIAMFEAMRRTRHRLGPESEGTGCIIGGFLQKTVLTSSYASTNIIHRWPDQVGERIGVDVTPWWPTDDYPGEEAAA